MTNWKEAFEHELHLATAARERGNPGQARVCARRAAGVALREYFAQRGLSGGTISALDLLQRLLSLPGVPEQARQAAEDLTLRVNADFQFPVEVDLIEQARILHAVLFAKEL